MSWSSRKKKEGIFLYRLFCPIEIFFNTCILAQCILYRIHFQNIHTFTYQKTLLQTLLLLVFKIVEGLQCILNCEKYSLFITLRVSSDLQDVFSVVIKVKKEREC